MSRTGIVAGLIVAAAVVAGGVAVVRLPGRVTDRAMVAASDSPFCWFDGSYVQGDMPVAIMMPDPGWTPSPFRDFSDRFLNSEGAKPFHFGIVVLRGDDPAMAEIWGWSYRDRDFWQTTSSAFPNAYAGVPGADCADLAR